MAFAYTTRRGKTYYLHTGPKRGGGTPHCYLAEVSDDRIVIHEGETHIDTLRAIIMPLSVKGLEEYAARNANYLPVMRFVLQDEAKRIFQPERYCFRGSVEDWIVIGEPDQLKKLATKCLKHLGSDGNIQHECAVARCPGDRCLQPDIGPRRWVRRDSNSAGVEEPVRKVIEALEPHR